MINRERLKKTFEALVTTDSVSGDERAVCRMLAEMFAELGAEILIDDAGRQVGSNTGNLVARLPGDERLDPLLLCAHMDTVTPGTGIVPVFKDGIFSSREDTILGADDKSAIAIIYEALRSLHEAGGELCPIDVVFTVCEEIGLMGAKHLDYSLLRARSGYVLDATDVTGIVTRAPAANRLQFVIHGKDAHAGAHPEDGINAIAVAARAIARLNPGRVDEETTFNIGLIEGGRATNIVPDKVTVKGEARSRQDEKLARITGKVVAVFEETVAEAAGQEGQNGLPSVEVAVNSDFKSLNVPSDHRVVTTAVRAAANLGFAMSEKESGGGSDANIFAANGVMTGILGTGMRDMHTVRETVALEDMARAAELLREIIRISS
ncbi:MAG: M20/M25/M40 family metallo-hydrolase [Desulfosudaceae bacterium]